MSADGEGYVQGVCRRCEKVKVKSEKESERETKRVGKEGCRALVFVCLFECWDDKKNISFVEWWCGDGCDVPLAWVWFGLRFHFGMKRK